MGKSSKRKGSHYEREFAARCDDNGLPAERVPLSGAMGGSYTEDVVVADTWRIECKYRANGTGFKSLYRWLEGNELMVVRARGVQLRVMPLEVWCRNRVTELDECEPMYHSVVWKDSAASWDTLTGWKGEADYLAVRMPHSPWLVIDIVEDGDV